MYGIQCNGNCPIDFLNNNLGDVSEVESLLRDGVNPNIKDASGE